MSEAVTLDDLDNDSGSALPQSGVPIWTLELDPKAEDYDEKKVLEWLKAELGNLRQINSPRFTQIERNLQLYKGFQYLNQERSIDRDTKPKKGFDKIVINNLYDLTVNKVSRLVKYKPSYEVKPTNEEQTDKVAAKANKIILDHLTYSNNYEDKIEPTIVRRSKIMGESYLWIEWDPYLGDLHPAAKRLQDSGKTDEPLLDDDGNPINDSDGKPLKLNLETKTGDVACEITAPFDTLLQQQTRIEDVEYVFKIKRMPVEKARLLFKDAGNKIQATSNVDFYDFEKMEKVSRRNWVEVVYWYHKKMPELRDGRFIVFCQDAICSNKVYPYSHKDKAIGQVALPFERLTDVDLEEELHGASFYQFVKGMTGTYNNITNLIVRNQFMCAHPKWMLPAGMADIASLGNDATVVRYKGAIAPVLVQSNPTPTELFEFRKILKEEFTEHAGLGPVTKGQPPPGVTAAIALQYLGEQENDRANEEVIKMNSFRRGVYLKLLSCAGDYYDPNDQRMIRVLGKNNKWMVQKYDSAYLAKGYDVQVLNQSALPESKALRTQFLLDLNERYPDQVPAEQVLDMIGLAQPDKFLDITTASVRAAEEENEQMLDGKEVAAPEKWENLIVHWKIHARQMQEYQFKHQTTPEIQDKLKDHVLATEMLMAEKARLNPLLASKLKELELYPLLYTDELIAEPDPAEEGQGEVPPGTGQAPQEGMPQDPELPVNPDNGGEPQAPSMDTQGQLDVKQTLSPSEVPNV
jgi:hypothetical protein